MKPMKAYDMRNKIFCFFIVAGLIGLLGAGNAQGLTNKEIGQKKNRLAKLEKDVARLQKKLQKTKNQQARAVIQDKIEQELGAIKQIKLKLYPQKTPAREQKAVAPRVLQISLEAGAEEVVGSQEAEERPRYGILGLRHEVGGSAGLFAGTTAFLGEITVPLKFVFGPATTAVRLGCGLAQDPAAKRRLVPVNLDLIFDFPPGWFSGVENYLGAGINYVALTSGQKQGTIGGQLFYGIVSEGFGGFVYGEVGYAVMRTGFSPSYMGPTVLVGYRQAIF
jgi:hypothetical protein